ncbi:DUF7684 family protein [Undibacterium sp. Di24W]|uniref:DUF7684 family protein n=1 Tax=Undibacterium sp. Di24W TaxID=3413033 RepID=UPI003BF29A57
MTARIPTDCNGVELGIGSRIRLLSLSGNWFNELPTDEIADVKSMIGELFVIEKVDDYGQPWIRKSWMNSVKGTCHGHSIALEPNEAECVSGQDNLPPLKIVLNCTNGYESKIDPIVERLVAGGLSYIGVAGQDCSKIEDIIDEIAVGDGSNPRFILTTSHPQESLENVIEFALSLTGEHAGGVRVITL